MKTKSKNGKYISTPKEIFEKHCKFGKNDECWEWSGYITNKGYGQTKIGGRDGKLIQAHRLSWIVNVGEISNDLHVLHKCDNRKCVNPNHLFLGTNQDNINDRVSKGRSSHWIKYVSRDKHPACKFKESDIHDMVDMRVSGWKVKDIAKKFNSSKNHISRLTYNLYKERVL